MKTILNGIFKENPVFVLLLGLCSSLAVTDTVEHAYLMGLCVLIILVFSNFLISLIRKIVPDSVRIPTYILIIGTFVTILEIVIKKYVPALYEALSIYLPLIVVNCIVLGRALTVATRENVLKSVLDGIGIGLGFTLSITVVAFLREFIGSNTITLMSDISKLTGYKAVYTNIIPSSLVFPISGFKEPAGAFLTFGLLIALINKVKGGNKNESN